MVLWRRGEGKGGAENTDGNYGNRNAEDEKSHTNRERKKKTKTHSHLWKMYIHDKSAAHGPARSRQQDRRADGRNSGKSGFLTATQAAFNTVLRVISSIACNS